MYAKEVQAFWQTRGALSLIYPCRVGCSRPADQVHLTGVLHLIPTDRAALRPTVQVWGGRHLTDADRRPEDRHPTWAILPGHRRTRRKQP
jgi:hypothetical protein